MLSKILKKLIFLFIIIDIILFVICIFYKLEVIQLQKTMTKAEQKRLEAISLTQTNQLALSMEMTRRMSEGDKDFNLSIDTQKKLMTLSREGAVLREIAIEIGASAYVGSAPNRVKISLPLGKRTISNINDTIILLDSGSIIYTDSNSTTKDLKAEILPGNIKITSTDMRAILKSINPGTAVYFY